MDSICDATCCLWNMEKVWQHKSDAADLKIINCVFFSIESIHYVKKNTESSIWGHMNFFFEKIKTFFFARANVTSRKSPAQEMATLESIFFTWKIIFKKYIYIRRFQGTFQTSFVNDSFTSSNLKTLEQHIKTIALNFIPFCR